MAIKDYLQKKILLHFGFSPTKDQELLFNKLADFVDNTSSVSTIMLITGYAGTGKSSSIGALIRSLKELNIKYRLMAPTGRSAKVLSNYAKEGASTIHKAIYRQKSLADAVPQFVLDYNKSKNTIFIVDEASLISFSTASDGGVLFGSGSLLDDLIEYIFSRDLGNKLIILGDTAQLPPIGLDYSPALDAQFLSQYGEVTESNLTEVVRQEVESGILYNATNLRREIKEQDNRDFIFKLDGFSDIERLSGSDLIDTLSDSISKYGDEQVVVLCRSNLRANRYNMGIRSMVYFREERLCGGDRLMIVKNSYKFKSSDESLDFIANGDVAVLEKISNYSNRYGFNFAEVKLSFPDYGDIEVEGKVILDTLESKSASLTKEEQNRLFNGVYEDYSNIKRKRDRINKVKEDDYFNAFQIKYATAITGHKSQGGQWRCVFIDNPFWQEELTIEDKKWLYTALTRAVEKVYLVNFSDNYFCEKPLR